MVPFKQLFPWVKYPSKQAHSGWFYNTCAQGKGRELKWKSCWWRKSNIERRGARHFSQKLVDLCLFWVFRFYCGQKSLFKRRICLPAGRICCYFHLWLPAWLLQWILHLPFLILATDLWGTDSQAIQSVTLIISEKEGKNWDRRLDSWLWWEGRGDTFNLYLMLLEQVDRRGNNDRQECDL